MVRVRTVMFAIVPSVVCRLMVTRFAANGVIGASVRIMLVSRAGARTVVIRTVVSCFRHFPILLFSASCNFFDRKSNRLATQLKQRVALDRLKCLQTVSSS
jgi:hypothetical protein